MLISVLIIIIPQENSLKTDISYLNRNKPLAIYMRYVDWWLRGKILSLKYILAAFNPSLQRPSCLAPLKSCDITKQSPVVDYIYMCVCVCVSVCVSV